MVEKIPVSKYDNSASMFYKYAQKFNTPVRFLLSEAQEGISSADEFNLDENLDSSFTTVFDYVREKEEQGLSMQEIWAHTNSFRGELLNPAEFIYIYIHATGNMDENQIQEFIQFSKASMPYKNIDDIIGYYEKNWLPRYNKELETDLAMNQKYIANQARLQSIKSLLVSPLKVQKITFSYNFDFDYDPLPDLFDQMKADDILPFIQYNKPNQRLYKIFKGESSESKPDYSIVKLETGQTPKKNTIYFRIWAGEDETPKVTYSIGQITKVPDSTRIRIQLETEISDEVDEMTITDRLFDRLPAIFVKPTRNDLVENKVSGSFYIYQTKLIEDVFHWFCLNNDIFEEYLYIEEGHRTIVAKKKVQIHYRGTVIETIVEDNIRKTNFRSPVTANISEEIILNGSKIDVLTGENKVKRITIKKRESILKVEMTRASSRRIASQFMDILSKLMRIYNEENPAVKERLFLFAPEYKSFLERETKIVPPAYSSEPILPPSISETGEYLRSTQMLSKKLATHAKEVFVRNYVRICQGKRQPEIISANEVELWKNKEYLDERTGQYKPRKVLYFPSEETPKYIFVCPNDQFPHPNLVKNNLANSDIYPQVPCCYPNEENTRRGVERRTGLSTAISTPKILAPTGTGYLSSDISEFLSLYTITSPDSEGDVILDVADEDSYYRYGVIRDPNSFIHCLLVATADKDYQRLNDTDKMAYAYDFRRSLFNRKIKYACCKQELYDKSDQDINNMINDDSFFDPLLFYRALEEYFKVNVYVFNYSGKDRITGNSMNLLQIPRHRLFHVHPQNDRPVVLIIRHMGADSNYLEYPQCELIVFEYENSYIKQFNQDLNNLVLPALQFLTRTITWQPVGKIIQVRENYFSAFDIRSSLGKIPITAQLLDDAGKARYFAIAPQWGNLQHTAFSSLRVFVATPPTSPLNVSEITTDQIMVNLPPYEALLELFGTPTVGTLDLLSVNVNGFWFQVGDNVNGIYCPCKEFPLKSFKEKYPQLSKIKTESAISNLNISVHKNNVVANPLTRLSNLRKVSVIVYQLYQYLYLLAGKPEDVGKFIASISKLLNTTMDSALIYQPKFIPRVFPKGTVKEVIDALSVNKCPFIRNGNIYLYNRNMYAGLLNHLIKFSKDLQGTTTTAQDYGEAKGYYSTIQDFQKNVNETLLLSISDYNQWITENVKAPDYQTRETQKLKDNIQTKLSASFYVYGEPFIYQQISDNLVGSSINVKEDKYYFIQNVASGDISRAINVSLVWKREKRNLGFKAAPIKVENDQLPVHKIYRITSFGNIELEQDNSKGTDEYLLILHYGGRIYGAMMPIL